ncbi:hypothetical protein GCM10028808_50510 [Spirosoma migulaei]
MIFSDTLYGQINIPDWLIPFIKSPEFLRLRGVRLSNVDSFQFKDFNAPTRWEHCISVAYLALHFAQIKRLNENETTHLVLAALFHDIATPPFAHTMEYVLDNFDHELESYRILSYKNSDNISLSIPVFASQFPRFLKLIEIASKNLNIKIDAEEIAKLVVGEGKWGYVIKGTLDIDNIDNVCRACLFMGIKIDNEVPLKLVKWLATKEGYPTNLKAENNESVKAWLGYRYQMYKSFYYSSDEEIGRQAFLQHLIRRLLKSGINRSFLIFNTDEGLLNLIENIESRNSIDEQTSYQNTLKDLVIHYRLLSDTNKICEISIERTDDLRIINNPVFSDWLERYLSSKNLEVFVFVKKRRFEEQNVLFPPPAGSVSIFKISSGSLKHSFLPQWLQKMTLENTSGDQLHKQVSSVLHSEIKKWIKDKPWHYADSTRTNNIKANLDNIENWDFKLSRNETSHSYPATFVHAIPAALITALGLKGETIFDPFGGSGVTAMEGLKQGCNVIISDVNSVSDLIMRSKFTYLSPENLHFIKKIQKDSIAAISKYKKPKQKDLNKWHHPKTEIELSKIKTFIESLSEESIKIFLLVCFSDILNFTSERKGKDFAYFADNTPLPKGTLMPEYVDAVSLFLLKIQRNTQIVEKTYFLFEQQGKDVEKEFNRVKAFRADITTINPSDFGLENNSIDAIITSPPYLCMVDYTYGNRLPYYWLFPERFESDHKIEIGSRRSRGNPKAKENYLNGMRKFAQQSHKFLKKNGYLATIIGSPLAQKFLDFNVVDEVYAIFEQEGFELLWANSRQIHWHRNHGLAKLKEERIAVHIKK